MNAADPIAVAFSDIKDAKGVLALIVVFPYITSSVQLKLSPSENVLICELLSALT